MPKLQMIVDLKRLPKTMETDYWIYMLDSDKIPNEATFKSFFGDKIAGRIKHMLNN